MFTKDLVAFLGDLERHNKKTWFQANKARYEESVLEPCLELVRAMAPRLKMISKHLVADDRKSGGSMARIYRDVRFSKDKSPYNTHVTMIFHHDAGKKVVAPGYYLRISSKEARLGAGIWQPDSSNAGMIRNRIVAKPKEWTVAVGDSAFKKHWKGLDGESLKRPPRGFDPDHPMVEDLKRKDFISFTDLKTSALVRKDFPDLVAERYRSARNLVRFVCRALDLPF